MKRPLIGEKYFPQLSLDTGNKLKEGSSNAYVGGVFLSCVFFGKGGK
jgi:hypothetical protein